MKKKLGAVSGAMIDHCFQSAVIDKDLLSKEDIYGDPFFILLTWKDGNVFRSSQERAFSVGGTD